jgi:hypothetical protein
MKSIYIHLILFICISCNTRNTELIGTWLELTDNPKPEVIVFDSDSVTFLYGFNYGNLEDYQVSGNRLLFGHVGNPGTLWNYKIDRDTLSLFDIKSDSLSHQFVKKDSFKILDLIRDLYGIHLSDIKQMRLYRWSNYSDNTIVLKNDNDTLTDLFINGNKYVLDSLLYSKIFRLNINHNDRVDNLLFIQKGVKVSKLKLLEKELRKAKLRTVKYITHHDDTLNFVRVVMPPIAFVYPDSLVKKAPPLPMPPKINYEKDWYCQINNSEILLNNVVIPFDSLKTKIIKEYTLGNKRVLVIHFDPNLNYEEYIKMLAKIQNIFYQMSDGYALEHYEFNDFSQRYLNLDHRAHEIARDFKDKFPMLIREVYEPESFTNN